MSTPYFIIKSLFMQITSRVEEYAYFEKHPQTLSTNLSLAKCLSTTAQTGSSKEPSNEIHERLPYISHSACLEKFERTRDGRITAA